MRRSHLAAWYRICMYSGLIFIALPADGDRGVVGGGGVLDEAALLVVVLTLLLLLSLILSL